MPCLTIVAGPSRAVVAVPATLDGWSNWTVEDLLHRELPGRLPDAKDNGLLEQLYDGAGHHLPHYEKLSELGLHPGQVLHAVSRADPFVPVSEDYGDASGARSWALEAVNLAIQQKDQVLTGLEGLRDAASSAASNDGSSTARSERTYEALTGAIQRRGESVERIDASFDAGLRVLGRPSPRSLPVSKWPLAPYTALRGSADLPPYHEQRYTVGNHTDAAPMVRRAPVPSFALFSRLPLEFSRGAASSPTLQLPRARGPQPADAPAEEGAADGSVMSEWRKVQMLLKVTPSQRSAMGGMPIRETDSTYRAQLHAHAQESSRRRLFP